MENIVFLRCVNQAQCLLKVSLGMCPVPVIARDDVFVRTDFNGMVGENLWPLFRNTVTLLNVVGKENDRQWIDSFIISKRAVASVVMSGLFDWHEGQTFCSLFYVIHVCTINFNSFEITSNPLNFNRCGRLVISIQLGLYYTFHHLPISSMLELLIENKLNPHPTCGMIPRHRTGHPRASMAFGVSIRQFPICCPLSGSPCTQWSSFPSTGLGHRSSRFSRRTPLAAALGESPCTATHCRRGHVAAKIRRVNSKTW